MKNIAYIDGQNLHMGTTKRDSPWKVDLSKLRVYLEKKYHVTKAFYYLGFVKMEKILNHYTRRFRVLDLS